MFSIITALIEFFITFINISNSRKQGNFGTWTTLDLTHAKGHVSLENTFAKRFSASGQSAKAQND